MARGKTKRYSINYKFIFGYIPCINCSNKPMEKSAYCEKCMDKRK